MSPPPGYERSPTNKCIVPRLVTLLRRPLRRHFTIVPRASRHVQAEARRLTLLAGESLPRVQAEARGLTLLGDSSCLVPKQRVVPSSCCWVHGACVLRWIANLTRMIQLPTASQSIHHRVRPPHRPPGYHRSTQGALPRREGIVRPWCVGRRRRSAACVPRHYRTHLLPSCPSKGTTGTKAPALTAVEAYDVEEMYLLPLAPLPLQPPSPTLPGAG